MRILYENLLASATLSATNENANYTISEVIDPTLKTKFMSTTTISTITAVLAGSSTVSGFALGNHNINTMTITLERYDTSIVTHTYNSSQLVFSTSNSNQRLYIDAVENVVEIRFAVTSLTTLYIGSLWANDYMQMPYFNVRPSNGFDSSQGRQKSRGGVSYKIPGTVLETFSCQFDANSITDYNTQVAFFKVVQKYSPYWVDRYENDTELPVMFMENTSDVEYTITPNGVMFDGFSLDLEECK